MRKWSIVFPVLTIVIVVGGYFAFKDDSGSSEQYGDNPRLPTLIFYTTGLATTPQLPLWAGVKHGEVTKLFNLKIELWKNLDDLQSILLAGKGDIWLGHIEGFALAKKRGSPICLLAVTGWRKFYIVSKNEEHKSIESFYGHTLPFAPIGSPAVPILKAILKDKASQIAFQPHEPKQLIMMLIRGKVDCALVPEPLVTMMLNKVKGLKIVLNVEDLYGEKTGGEARMPIAGVAVNTETARKYPKKIKALQKILVSMADLLNKDKSKSLNVLPDSFNRFVSREMATQSLSRDIIFVKTARKAEAEIIKYFKIISPSLITDDGKLALDNSFLWE
ncbi:MAG: ABC transporter substrate-binding protein [Proteobacteria bacterium]|nr:ABC transporter substrate-binding protein [Pseudomonadota bacterium]